ncbi:MAG: NUDIX domain-containing protein [Vicingaceae bacterium]
MYKVFINDRSLILTDDYADYTSGYDTLYITYASEEAFFETIALLRDSPVLTSVCIYTDDLESLWSLFNSKYVIVEAAGGVVRNDGQVLFIQKNGHWDLPKGKMEKGETADKTALREVKEECGISELKLDKPFDTTYYLFVENGQTKLKKTDWFLMESSESGPFIGDAKEGITEVKWMNRKSWEEDRKKSYASVINMMTSIFRN